MVWDWIGLGRTEKDLKDEWDGDLRFGSCSVEI